MGLYLREKGWRDFDIVKDEEIRKGHKNQIIKALKESNEIPKHQMDELFNDVYDKLTPNLIEQKNELIEHLKKYGDKYNTSHH